MLYPSINEIRKKVDSRYTLVILAAKRSRDIIDGMPKLTEAGCRKTGIHRSKRDRRGSDHVQRNYVGGVLYWF